QEPMVDFFKEIEKPVTVMAYLGEMFVFGAVFSLLPFGLISLICRISSAANQSVDIFLDNSPNAAGVCLLGIILASCLIYAYIHLRIKQYLKAHGIKSLFFEVT
ncbi:MAG: hypothetical protein NTX82_04805, partial [Candidatus Parcubacteria bacterium]|nr:hypothetical protein [Candidatus Parcubacteria bacterium]